MTKNQRRHTRLQHSASIRVLTPPGEPVVVKMRDFSESGLYLFCEDCSIVQIGDIVEVKTLEFEGAPNQQAKVVRLEKGKGFALEFLNV